MSRPRCLDLFCGAGGATRGLQLAGFHVTGVDINPQPRYVGDAFHQADAMTFPLEGFDFVWASPPCQAYTLMRHMGKGAGSNAPDLVAPVRNRLRQWGGVWVIENVVGSPLKNPILLCGSMFGLGVRRHRLFECSHLMLAPICQHGEAAYPVPVWGDGRPSRREARAARRRPIAVYGDHPQTPGDTTYRCNRARTLKDGQDAMGIDWMDWKPLTQAIPPAYSRYIGEQMMPHVLRAMKARAVA
jgi:DNA (cytosine-5)-methyltransferase 1